VSIIKGLIGSRKRTITYSFLFIRPYIVLARQNGLLSLILLLYFISYKSLKEINKSLLSKLIIAFISK
jgi:hypothetical protein